MRDDAVDLTQLHRILVIKLRHHGDVLLTGPVFTALKTAAPLAEVDALVYLDTADMLRAHPDIDRLFTIDRQWKKEGLWAQLRHEYDLLKALRARRYDLILHLTEHARGATLVHLLQPRFSVAGVYPHKRGRLWRASFTHLYAAPLTPRHAIERNLDAVRRIGIYPRAEDRLLKLVPGTEARTRVAELLKGHGLSTRGFVVVHPSSRWNYKAWTLAGFVELVDKLQARGARVVLTSAPDRREMDFTQQLIARVKQPPIDVSGLLSLRELAALIDHARCLVGVDSVPMHIAAAMGTPVVALFGPSGDLEWQPWRVAHRIVAADFPCRPCGLEGCGNSHHSDCLAAITADDVLAAVDEVLAA